MKFLYFFLFLFIIQAFGVGIRLSQTDNLLIDNLDDNDEIDPNFLHKTLKPDTEIIARFKHINRRGDMPIEKIILQHRLKTSKTILRDEPEFGALFKPDKPNILDIYISNAEDEKNDNLKDFYKKYESYQGDNNEFELKVTQRPFSFSVYRKDTNEKIFSTKGSPFEFSKNYREFTATLPTDRVFGLGESNNPDFKLVEGTYTMFNHDEVGKVWDGQPGRQTYGSHPMYLMQEKSGKFSIVFLQNSFPMDITYRNSKLRFKMVGGPIHLKIILGDHYPETAIKLYHDYINGYTTPPFWAMGFHQSRWGYQNTSILEKVLRSYESSSIPLDVIWSDIDYMEEYQVFTVNKNFSYNSLAELKKKFGVKYIPIIDPGVGVSQTESYPYQEGSKDDIFLRSPTDGKYFLGKVWPGWVHFVDFVHPNSDNYWRKMLTSFKSNLPFDGLWLDMNEVSNFCSFENDCPREVSNHFDPDIKEEYKTADLNLPFWPGGGNIRNFTMPLNLLHHNKLNELQMHNLYAFYECKTTYKIMKEDMKIKLPFILSRATFPGSGAVTFHWTGDNLSTFEFLKISIPSIFNFNMFGIPFTGSDICGFESDTSPELCARWIQLGAFYPFSRNHNHIQAKNQELYSLGKKVLDASRFSLRLRYSLLKHLYSIFLRNNGRGTYFRPLFFEYPEDKNTYREKILNQQFMIGSALLATPVLERNKLSTKAYFPDDSWTLVETGLVIKKEDELENHLHVKSLLNEAMPVFLRGGFAVTSQSIENVLRTSELSNQYHIKASLSFKKAQSLNKEQEGKGMIGLAQGELIGLENFSEENIHSKCLESSSCLIKFQLKLFKNEASLKSPSSCKFSLEFNRDNLDRRTQLETVFLNKVLISNFPFSTCPQLIEKQQCDFVFEGGSVQKNECTVKGNEIGGYHITWKFSKVDVKSLDKITLLLENKGSQSLEPVA